MSDLLLGVMNNCLLTLNGYKRVLGLLFKHLWYSLYLFVYAVVYGLISLGQWLYKWAKYYINTYPKTILLIVCIAFAVDHLVMMVHYRAKAEKQNIRFDSLAAMKDSIQTYSAYDSGYAKGLVDGNSMLLKDGYKQKESITRRP